MVGYDKKIVFIAACFSLLPIFLSTATPSERQYQKQWCKKHNGEVEVVLKDKTRCDCITDKYAIEIEYAHKWYEAVGQALHYARQADKKPGIALIICQDLDKIKLKRLKNVVEHYSLPIKIWEIYGE